MLERAPFWTTRYSLGLHRSGNLAATVAIAIASLLSLGFLILPTLLGIALANISYYGGLDRVRDKYCGDLSLIALTAYLLSLFLPVIDVTLHGSVVSGWEAIAAAYRYNSMAIAQIGDISTAGLGAAFSVLSDVALIVLFLVVNVGVIGLALAMSEPAVRDNQFVGGVFLASVVAAWAVPMFFGYDVIRAGYLFWCGSATLVAATIRVRLWHVDIMLVVAALLALKAFYVGIFQMI